MSNTRSLNEECGVFGIYLNHPTDVARLCYYAIYALQHRGQEACGIAVNTDGVITGYKDLGMVNEVFTKNILNSFKEGNIAVAHCLYSKKAVLSRSAAQPMMINHVKGSMAFSMNGTIINISELRSQLELKGVIFHSLSEAEVIAAYMIQKRLTVKSIEESLLEAMKEIIGAYAIVLMSPKKLVAARDPLGIKPLCIGKTDDGYIIASESCAVVAVGGEFIRDVEPGEVIVIENGKLRSYRNYCNDNEKALCVFEYLYFARPDSIVDGKSVHEARRDFGACLAKAHPVDADVVVGVPDSGMDAAIGYAKESGIPLEFGFLKNKYIGRSFIAPDMSQREDLVKIKLNAISATVKGKRVVAVDDSIVRGVTSARFIRILKEAGAKEVHVRSSAPPFTSVCYYGTDIDSPETLVSRNHTAEEIAEIIGADSVGFLPLEDLEKAIKPYCSGICKACFTGRYPIDPTPAKTSMCDRFNRPLKSE